MAYDSDGYVDDASLIADASDENYKYYDFDHSDFNGVTYKDGVLAVTTSNTVAHPAVDFIMADSFTIYTVDGTTVKTVTADKLAKDYATGFNAANVRGDVWAVLNDDEEVTALYVDIKGTAAGSAATYVSDTKLTDASDTAGSDNKLAVTIGGLTLAVANTAITANDQATAWAAAFDVEHWTATASSGTVTLTFDTVGAGQITETDALAATGVTGTFADGDDDSAGGGANKTAAKITLAQFTTASTKPATYAVTIDGKTYDVDSSNDTVAKQLTAWAEKYNAEYSVYDAAPGTGSNDGKIVLTAAAVGVKTEGANNYDTYLTGGVFTNGEAAQS